MQTTSTEWYLDPEAPVPLKHRIMWSPITACLCFAAMIAADVLMGMTAARIAGLAIGALWLGLAVYNRHTHGAFLRGLYTPDDEAATARVIER